MNRSHSAPLAAAAITFVIGTGGGYAVSEMVRTDQIAALEREVAGLKAEMERTLKLEVPTDEEASAVIARSGRTIRISECKAGTAVPGVTCIGVLVTTSGSFAGATQPGVLSFAKIDGTWTQIQ